MKIVMKSIFVAVVFLAFFGTGLTYTHTAMADESSITSVNPFFKRSYARLGLTQQQMYDIKSVIKSNLPELKIMINQIIEERRALRTLVRANSVNEPAIRAQVAKLAAIGADYSVKKAYITQQIKAILTAEQVQMAKEGRMFYDSLVDKRVAGVFQWFEE